MTMPTSHSLTPRQPGDDHDAAVWRTLAENRIIREAAPLPELSRACRRGQHNACHGVWTRYPDEGGDCACVRHQYDTDEQKRLQNLYGEARDMLALHMDIDQIDQTCAAPQLEQRELIHDGRHDDECAICATVQWELAKARDDVALFVSRVAELQRLLQVAASVSAALRAVIDDTEWDTDDHDGKFGHLPYGTFVEAERILRASEKAQVPQ